MGNGFGFKVDVDVDVATGKVRAVYFRVRSGKVKETKEIEPGVVLADYGHDGLLIGIELLDRCEVAVFDRVTVDEPSNVQQFFRNAAPRELICN